jgi:arabinoxylan arabinofuranohydrolase
MTHTFGADPAVLVYDGRVYIYMTADTPVYESGGTVKTNDYKNIDTLRVISSADMVNWTYHEPIAAAGRAGIAKWAGLSWAPDITYKNVNGRDVFFLYFSNNANGVGVLTAASPLGPWTDPLGRALVSRQTPNCSDVPWVFDPAVFLDDDGKAYLYFGGGVPEGRAANPGSARVVALGDDMISLAGEPVAMDVPFFFEASEMVKINGTYVYSYCTNWNVTDQGKARYGIENAVIATMTSDSPMGPFTFQNTIFRNPGSFFGAWGNNHHTLFEFNGNWYLAYHSQILEAAMGMPGKGYRVTHVDAVSINNGRMSVRGTRRGVEQAGRLNPFVRHPGTESGNSAGVTFDGKTGRAEALENGAWVGVYGADFGNKGATSVTIDALADNKSNFRIEVRLGSPSGEIAGVYYRTEPSGRPGESSSYTLDLNRNITGVRNIYFVFGSGVFFSGWQFAE